MEYPPRICYYSIVMKNKRQPEDYLAELGHRLKLIRTFLKLDQHQMAERLGSGQSQISKIELGRSAPTLHQLLRIKRLAEKDDYLRNNLSWEWVLEGKGKGIIG